MDTRTRSVSRSAAKPTLAAVLAAGALLCAALLIFVLHGSRRLPFEQMVDRMTVFSITRGSITRAFYTDPDGQLILFYADFRPSNSAESRYLHQPVRAALREDVQACLRGLDYEDLPGEASLPEGADPAFELSISDDTDAGSLSLFGTVPPEGAQKQLLDDLCTVMDSYAQSALEKGLFFAEHADYWHPLVSAMSGIYAGTTLPHEQMTCRPLDLHSSSVLKELIGTVELPGLIAAYLCEAPEVCGHRLLGLAVEKLPAGEVQQLADALAAGLIGTGAVFALDPEDADTTMLFAACGDPDEVQQIITSAESLCDPLPFTAGNAF